MNRPPYSKNSSPQSARKKGTKLKSTLQKLAVVIAGVDIALVAITVVSKITDLTWPAVLSVVVFSANAGAILSLRKQS